MFFATTTNGTLLSPNIIRFLQDKQIGVTVSIDGPRHLHDANRKFRNGRGSWNKVMDGLRRLREAEVPFSVRATITREADLRELDDFFTAHNFKTEYLSPVDFPRVNRDFDYQLDLKDFQRLSAAQQKLMREALRDVETGSTRSFRTRQLSVAFHNIRAYSTRFPFKCGAGWWIVAFDIQGRIYPCHRFVGQPAFQIGDTEGGVNVHRVLNMYRSFLDSTSDCDSCWAVHLCRRRCFFQKAQRNGTFEPLPPALCDVYRDNYAASIAFAGHLQAVAREHKSAATLDEVLTRYDTERLMREHRDKKGRIHDLR